MSAHKHFLHTSDFILYTTIISGIILEFYIPTTTGLQRNTSILTGTVLLILCWTVIIISKIQFKKFNLKTKPGEETTTLMQGGIFMHSRNPIYLGVLFILPALGLISNSFWFILMIIPNYFLITQILIIPEEKYLIQKFGKKYEDYCRKTRRWI